MDPETLDVDFEASSPSPETIDPALFDRWSASVVDLEGRTHLALTDGWHRIRLDVPTGALSGHHALLPIIRLRGIERGSILLPAAGRLLALCRLGRFSPSLFPSDRRIERLLVMLRVWDAVREGATQRDIGIALYGRERIAADWGARSDSLKSRVRRLMQNARDMASGGYRALLTGKRRL